MKNFKIQKFKKNQYMVVYGSRFNGKMYYIIKGTVQAKFMGTTINRKEGDLINTMSFMTKRSSLLTAKATSDVEALVIEYSQINTIFRHNDMISKFISSLKEHVMYILKNYAHPIIFKEKLTNEEHQNLLLGFGEYLFDMGDYKRAEYCFDKFKDLYPNTEFQKEMTQNLHKLRGDEFKEKKHSKKTIYKKGEVIFSQFEQDKRMVFIKKGKS